MPRIREDAVEWREVEGEVVALDVRDQMYLGINGSGAVLWPLLVEGADLDELVTSLLDTYDVDEATARADVEAFVGSLAERDLLDESA